MFKDKDLVERQRLFMKKYCSIVLLLVLGYLTPVTCYAATEGVPALIMEKETVEQFIVDLQQAIYNHPTFLAANAAVAQSSERVNIAKSGLKPQVGLTGSGTKSFASSKENEFSLLKILMKLKLE